MQLAPEEPLNHWLQYVEWPSADDDHVTPYYGEKLPPALPHYKLRPSSNHLANLKIHISAKRSSHDVPTPYSTTLFLFSLLSVDWCSKIQWLALSWNTLALQDWNNHGRFILNCLKSLRRLNLKIQYRTRPLLDFQTVGTVADNQTFNVVNFQVKHVVSKDVLDFELFDTNIVEAFPNLEVSSKRPLSDHVY